MVRVFCRFFLFSFVFLITSRAGGETEPAVKFKTIVEIQQALDELEEKTLVTKDGPTARKNVERSIQIAEELKAFQGKPGHLSTRGVAGRIMMEAIVKSLMLESPPSVEEVPKIIATLTPAQFSEFSYTIPELFRDRETPEVDLDFLFALTDQIYKTQIARKFLPPIKDFQRTVERIALLRLLATEDIEGVYVMDVGGREGTMTISHVGGGILAIGLSFTPYNPVSLVDFTFWHVRYNVDTHLFDCHHFASPLESIEGLPTVDRNWFMRFKFSTVPKEKTLTLEGLFHNALGTKRISGYRRIKFPSFPLAKNQEELKDFSGTFGNDHIRITLSQVGPQFSATFNYNGRMAETFLQVGHYDRRHRQITLTSGELVPSGKYVQVKAQLSEDGQYLTGYYIVGGRGIQFSFRLGRTSGYR